MKLLTDRFLKIYLGKFPFDFSKLLRAQVSDEKAILKASIFSSNIENNPIDLIGYQLSKRAVRSEVPVKTFEYSKSGGLIETKDVAMIDDLIAAYHYANKYPLKSLTFLNAHKIMSKALLNPEHRGAIRKTNVSIAKTRFFIGENNSMISAQEILYSPVDSSEVKKEFNKLFNDIEFLLNEDLSHAEVFYYAAMIHLIFEKIHPFIDGNGRAGRLLEKWFLAKKIGDSSWFIESEKYYWENRPDYYANLGIGRSYKDIDMDKCIPFLLMLPNSLMKQ